MGGAVEHKCCSLENNDEDDDDEADDNTVDSVCVEYVYTVCWTYTLYGIGTIMESNKTKIE